MTSRRQFLGLRAAPPAAIRLPWVISEAHFLQHCSRCNDCLPACPEHIITIGSDGFPALNFSDNGCTFCGDCVKACAEPLFRPQSEPAFTQHAQIGSDCLALKGIECRSCGDHCETRAIRFTFGAQRIALPSIDIDACTACGACIGVCPSHAIHLQAIST